MKPPVPQPVVTAQKCSICELDWSLHGVDPTVLDCIRLLKARIPSVTINVPIVRPYVAPWYPVPIPVYPNWSGTSGNVGLQSAITVGSHT